MFIVHSEAAPCVLEHAGADVSDESNLPAGWYGVPGNPTVERYWDGAEFGEHRVAEPSWPAPSGAAPASRTMPPPPSAAGPAPMDGSFPAPPIAPQPPTYQQPYPEAPYPQAPVYAPPGPYQPGWPGAQPPPRPGWSTGKIVAVVLGVVGLLIVVPIVAGVVVFAVGNSTNNAARAACRTERASIVTAYAAAATANRVTGGHETHADYLTAGTGFRYFTGTSTPTFGPITRVNTLVVSSSDCRDISLEEVPVGSL